MLAAAQGTRRTKARSRWHLGSVAHCRERTSVPLFALPRSRCRAQGAALSGYLLCSWPKRREMCNGGMVRLIVRAKLGSRCWFRDRFRRIGSRILPRLVPYQRNARCLISATLGFLSIMRHFAKRNALEKQRSSGQPMARSLAKPTTPRSIRSARSWQEIAHAGSESRHWARADACCKTGAAAIKA